LVTNTDVVGWRVVWARREDSVISLGFRPRTTNFGTCASKQLEVLEAPMMELHLDVECHAADVMGLNV
jgi:hypothetical protein